MTLVIDVLMLFPAPAKSIDLDSLQLERDSLWSAAVHAFKNNEAHLSIL